MLEKIYQSIRNSLKSECRENGPRVYCRLLDKVIGGDVDTIYKSDFASKVVEVIHNCTPAIF